MEFRGFLEKQKYSAWYYNDRYMSLYISPKPQKVQYWKWTVR